MSNSSCKSFVPDENLRAILVKLPAKSLVRFACVRKSWSRLIGSSSFISSHLERNVTSHAYTFLMSPHKSNGKSELPHLHFSNETLHLYLGNGHPFSKTERRHMISDKGFEVYGSSNGLVCLSDKQLQLKLNSPVCICNPSIRKHMILPATTISCKPNSAYVSCLSFGFHPGLNDYKVVRMVSFFWETQSVEVEVYSLRTNSWKTAGAIPAPIKSMIWSTGYAFAHGLAYWIMLKDDDTTFYLVSFDIGGEVFEQLLLPKAFTDRIDAHDGFREAIEKYKDSICLLQCRMSRGYNHMIDMWILRDKSFEMLHTVMIPGKSPYPFGFTADDELLLGYRKYGGFRLLIYNLETSKVNKTGYLLQGYYHIDQHVATYVESLVSLN